MPRPSRVRVGDKFERLVVLREDGRIRGSRAWLCRCDCGKELRVGGGALRSENTRSCGCLKIDELNARQRTHGKCGSRAHRIWKTMLQRCTNPKCRKWPEYGGRGIRVCEWWLRFEGFYADMGDPPEGTSIERKDNDGHYEPSNCKWATAVEQANNKSSNTFLQFAGLRLTISQWGERLGVRPNLLSSRLYRGWSVERTLTENLNGRDSTGGAEGGEEQPRTPR